MALRIVTWFLLLLFTGLFQGQAWALVYNGGLEGGYWQSSPGFSARHFNADSYGSMRVRREVTATSTNDYRYIYDGRAILQERDAKNLPTWWQGGSSSDIMNAALRGGLAGGVAGLTMGFGAPALSGIFGNGIVAGAINGLVSGAVSDAVNQGYDLVQGTRCEFSFSELGAGAAMGGIFGGGFSAASSAIGGMRSAMAARGGVNAAETGATAAENVTYLYQKVGAQGEHLKFGITKNPATRYTQEELGGGQLRILTEGPRKEMLQLGRNLHETLPIGPEEAHKFYIQKQIEKGLRPPPYNP